MEFEGIHTISNKMLKLIQMVESVVRHRAPITLIGESGTGKKLLAEYIHRKSDQSKENFIILNSEDKDKSDLEETLFGTDSAPGLLSKTSSGTIYIANLESISRSVQERLAGILQSGFLDSESTKIRLNMRFIFSSKKPLRDLLKNNLLREDFYYRISIIHLQIPALRERQDDIKYLANLFTDICCIMNSLERKILSEEALSCLEKWSWRGNVRELESVIERAVILNDGETIQPEHIIFDDSTINMDDKLFRPGLKLCEVERNLILQTLEFTSQNRTKAAELLGISIRTLRNKLQDYRKEMSL